MLAKLDLSLKNLLFPISILMVFWALAVSMWISSGYIQALILFGYIGTSVGLGLGLYAALPKRNKPLGRRVALLMVGSFMIIFVAIMGQENIQFEGLIFGILTGFVQAAVMHYLIAKVAGPLLFGRLWCSWACWTVMVLDLLPFQRSQGRVPGKWGWLRYLHVMLSIGIVMGLYFGFGIDNGVAGLVGTYWFIAGNLAYYALGIGLAFMLQDNRAFCKYVCPVAVVLKITSRFSLLKVNTYSSQCNDCKACEKMCPMDIKITDYVFADKRVLSTECSLCQTCISVCSKDALKLSVGFDAGYREHLNYRLILVEEHK